VIRRWRRLDEPGLEVLHMTKSKESIRVTAELVHAGRNPFGLRYSWTLSEDWRTALLRLELRSGSEDRDIEFERIGEASWRVDGRSRPDLDGCVEIDLSATPFCNTLAIHRLKHKPGEITVLYVALPDLSLTPSRQRYEHLESDRWRYVDLGVAKGFSADLDFDLDGLIIRYEGLFETVDVV
jgi:hypothetical protein